MERTSLLEENSLQKNHIIKHCNSKPQIHRTRQRLIPLTPAIKKAMMDFNASKSNTNVATGKQYYNTYSITNLVREEVQNILQELSVSEQFLRKEDVDELIQRCLKEKVTLLPEVGDNRDDRKANSAVTSTTAENSDLDASHEELEVIVEMIKDVDKSNLIVENVQILEHRISNLEERLSTLFRTIPKLRHLQAKKFKINTKIIRELHNFMEMREFNELHTDADKEQQPSDEDTGSIYDTIIEAANETNISDDLPKVNINEKYYENRQNDMNMLYYKKSDVTMELNKRPTFNPWVEPSNFTVFPCVQNLVKRKQKPAFIL